MRSLRLKTVGAEIGHFSESLTVIKSAEEGRDVLKLPKALMDEYVLPKIPN